MACSQFFQLSAIYGYETLLKILKAYGFDNSMIEYIVRTCEERFT